MNFGQVLRVLRARLRLIGTIAFVVLVAALAAGLLLPKKYSANVALVVDAKFADPIIGSLLPSQMIAGYISTQADIIDSDRVALRVVEILGLDRMQKFQDLWQEETDGAGDIKVWIASALQGKLDVKPSRDSNVINVSYTGYDPGFAASVANAFAQAYMETSVALKVDPARQFAGWFNERTKGLRDELEAAQKRLSDYEQEHHIIIPEGGIDVETARLAELSSQLVAVQGQRAESQSRQSQAGGGEALPEVMQNPLIANLKSELARREGELEQLRGRLGPNHPEVGRMQAMIASMRQRVSTETQRIAASLGTANRVNAAREGEIAAAVEAQKAKVLQLKAHRDQIAVLQRDVESAQKAYDQVAQRLSATNLESQTQQTNIAVLSPAVAPIWPTGPRLLVKLALAMVVGLILGTGTALLLELVDQRVRSEADLITLPGVPLLGRVPGGRFGDAQEVRALLFRPRLLGRTTGGY
ncbi:MAG TPA: chain length determinant protein EpsF [Aromatoleum sp.]|uniref:chain length determinant protein EpsF n=1 Tax=Aromatoleum sp. TaxID=2307007 RepID=UPI002B49BBE5|nr:chain length determinant protein EpsF [Aromatoleum sp.]HJV27115.1 chain length determinant protein EpsF [Aromatoleum sp.]